MTLASVPRLVVILAAAFLAWIAALAIAYGLAFAGVYILAGLL